VAAAASQPARWRWAAGAGTMPGLVATALLLLAAARVVCAVSSGGQTPLSFIEVKVGNATRRALLFVPASVRRAAASSSTPAPLVLNWHGMMETPQQQEGLSDMDRVANLHGFILAYPQGGAKATVLGHGLPGFTHNGGGCCSSADSDGVRIDDVAFARALVGAVDAVVPVDRSRVYTTGFSNVRCVRLCLLVSTSNTEPGGLWLWTHAGRLHELSPWL
jgi:polyhydroxybutyrate depolymerase